MEDLKQLLHIKEIGGVLSGAYAESFYEIFGFVSWLAAIAFLVAMLGRVQPFNMFVVSVREDMNRPFVESDLILELLPNRTARHIFYKIMLLGLVAVFLAACLSAFYYASAAVMALLATELTINKFTAFAILTGLASFMSFWAYYNQREANKLAHFLRHSRA